MKAKEVKRILGITQPTLSAYIKKDLIKVVIINPYHYEYVDEDIYKLIGLKKERKEKINISYSRVSTQQQKSQLLSQSQRIYDYCISMGIMLDKQYEDIKSGMDFCNRKNFNEIITLIIQGKVELLIIENKDRLVRFGFELLETLCKFYGTKILIINDVIQNKSYEQELTEDLVSIIHYFAMKSYSNRRKLNKFKKELLENDNNKVTN